MPEIVLVGGGGHCRSCIDVIEASGTYRIAGIVEKTEPTACNSMLGYPYLGADEDLVGLRSAYDYALVCVGQIKSAEVRMRLYARLKKLDFMLPTIVSPLAYVSPHAQVGEGTVVMHFSCINAGAKIGVNCIMNTGSLVEHDSQIGDHSHIATRSVVNGGVTVGERSFLGSGSIVVQGVSLGCGSFVRANSLVSRSDTR